GRGPLGGRGHQPRGPEGHHHAVLPRVLRARRHRAAFSPVVLSVRRARRRDRHGMVPGSGRRDHLPRDRGRGGGPPRRAAQRRHRSAALFRLRLRHGARPPRDAQVRRERPAPLLRERPQIPGAIPMKVSVAWLKELVAVDLEVEALARALTMGGLEVEEVSAVGAAFTGIVVAHVKKVSPHPNADKLRVTEVDAGTGELLQVVCGAPNVAEGQKVPCALVGARLPGLEIRKAKLRGVESNGMLCSARELGLSDDHAGLLVLSPGTAVGADVREVLGLGDTLFTLKLTPNRGDAQSMFGIARDVAAITGARLTLPEAKPVAPTLKDARPVRISEPRACGRYLGRVIRGIDPAKRTPEWLARRLERAGLRPISPLVDITNFVMLERGQPMHAFDDAKLKGAIDVRFMKPGERIKLLNGDTVEHRPDLLAITDESGPVGLGGVMGGFDSMVGDTTTEVFFEAAFFHPEAVQGKARELSLTSDAAYRYERGVDFDACLGAMERATQLTLEICGGEAGPVTRVDATLPKRESVTVRPSRVVELLG